jgi:alpha-amylase
MQSLCLYFQVHQPMRFKRYRFFNIGNEHYYYDDYLNESIMRKVADKCYLPANKILLKLIKEYGTQFKVTFSLTGTVIDQFRLYAPEVLDSFKKLADTGCVEFLAETNSHSLVSLISDEEFIKQVSDHVNMTKEYFGFTPTVFRNTELVYSDEIGAKVADMGFKAILTEGAKHILGWKSPNYLYYNNLRPKLKVLLKNYKLSDDIAFRFSNKNWSEYPLTASKYAKWIKNLDPKEETVNIFMDYETFGEHQGKDTGIFKFLENLPKEIFKQTKFQFRTPSEVVEDHQPVAAVNVPYPISWADAERDLTAWLGNELQEDAFNRLYTLTNRIERCTDKNILTDWKYLQASDHFYYMCTKFFSDGEVHSYFNPYNSPYDAYINYMNVLSDFIIRLNVSVPESPKDKEIATLASIIFEKNKHIEKMEEQLKRLERSKKNSSTKKAATQTIKKPATSKSVTTKSKTTRSKSKAAPKKSPVKKSATKK